MTFLLSIAADDLAPLDDRCGDRLRVVVFSAEWCVPCKAMAPAVEDVAAAYRDEVAVARVDIERSPGLAARFAVRGVPTLVMLVRTGREVARHVGPLTRTRLSMLLDDVIAAAKA